MANTKGVEAVDRALRIVNLCLEADGGLTLAELSRRSGFYKSTILRLAGSLEDFGYVSRRSDGAFQPGATLIRMGRAAANAFDLAATVRPALKELSDHTRETASLYVKSGDMRECLFRHEPDRAIRHIVTEGMRLPLNTGASSHIINAWTGRTAVPPPDGAPAFSLSLGERDPEVAAMAVPVFDVDDVFLGALCVSGLISRFEPAEAQDRFLSALTQAAGSLGRHGLYMKD